MTWTDERIELLKTLWGRGMTASQIADELGGVSRNAVIGKAHRLGLESRPSPVRAADAAPGAAPPPPPPSVDEPAAAAVSAEPIAPDEPAVAAPEALPEPAAEPVDPPKPPAPQVILRSIGPGGFLRQSPGEPGAPIPPAPPRRLVPAKPSAEIAGKTSLLELNDKICKWPIGHPGEPDFHFCGKPVNVGFPYCVQHCSVAYQAQLPRRDRRAPPLPFGGPRAR